MNFKEYLSDDTDILEQENLHESGYSMGKYDNKVKNLNIASQKVLEAIKEHEKELHAWQNRKDIDVLYPKSQIGDYAKYIKGAKLYYSLCEKYTRKV